MKTTISRRISETTVVTLSLNELIDLLIANGILPTGRVYGLDFNDHEEILRFVSDRIWQEEE